MSRRRKNMIEIKQLLQLKIKGLSHRAVAPMLGMNRKTVDEYLNFLNRSGKSWEELLGYEEQQLRGYLPPVKQVLRTDAHETLLKLVPGYRKAMLSPGFTFRELFMEYQSEHPDGYGITQFKFHIQQALKAPETSLHIPMLMGDKILVDYCGKRLEITDRQTGDKTPVEGFVTVLGGSGLTYFEGTVSQQKVSFFPSLSNSFEYMGGSPRLTITDNFKSAVSKADRYEPVLNKDFQAFGLHYNTALLPTRAHKPKDKALVERTVQLIYEQIYFKLRGQVFFDLASLNKAVRPLLHAFNQRPYQLSGVSRQEIFDTQERSLLSELPETRFVLLSYKKAKVGKNYHVLLGCDKHFYSVPYGYVGKTVELRYTESLVEIYESSVRIASHIRNKQRAGYSTERGHMPAAHQYVQGRSEAFFLDWGLTLDVEIATYIKTLFTQYQHPEQAFRVCSGIQRLAKVYGRERLKNACVRASAFEQYSYLVLESILKQNLDGGLVAESVCATGNDIHENLRGAGYYQ